MLLSEKNENKITFFSLLLVFFSLGIAIYGYWFIPLKKHLNPNNVIFHSKGGNVLFPHHYHYDGERADIECSDCHHNCDSTFQNCKMRCRDCHYKKNYVNKCKDKNHPRCIGKQCIVCHEGESCSFCHQEKR